MTPQEMIAELDAGLLDAGETVQLRRRTIAPAGFSLPISFRAIMRGYSPSELIQGSGIGQQDQKAILSPSPFVGIAPGLWPGYTAFARASLAWYFDATGTLRQSPVNNLRLDYGSPPVAPPTPLLEPASANLVRNNAGIGAVVGTPGTFPAHWLAQTGVVGGTISLAATGTESGLPYVDARYQGTALAGNGMNLQFEDNFNSIPAATGQTFTQSIFWRLVGGAFPVGSTAELRFQERTSGGGPVVTDISPPMPVPTADSLAQQRMHWTTTLGGGATTAFVYPVTRFVLPAGPFDFTVRFAGVQVESGSLMSSVMLTSGATFARAGETGTLGSSLPKNGDQLLSNRGLLTIQAAAGIYAQDALVRIEAQVRGA